jgi:hypothetical protein
VERRHLGVLFLAAAVLAVLVPAGVQPRGVAGSPQALSAPEPPAVGDCVLDPVNPSSWENGPYVYPKLQFTVCDGFRFGEVAAVLTNPEGATGTGHSGSVSDPHETCMIEGESYVGGVPQFQYWSPRIYSFSAPFSPSPLQQAVGQHWLACAMFIPANDAQTAVVNYDGSLRDALFTGNEREVLGFCGSGRDWTTGYVPVCSSPHEFQVLASGIVGGGDISSDELQRTCVQVAQRLTALPDVTAAGALAVEVRSIEHTGASFDSAHGPVEATLGCGIDTVGSRRLAGSLVALGDLPIPWA